MVDVYLGLGSNLGNKEENIFHAINLLTKESQLVRLSSIYETEPVGFEDQAWFINCVIHIQTELSAEALLEKIETIHTQLKRERTMRWGPRTIDIDILFYGNEVITTQTLEIPHPRLHERQFVLMPLVELAPHFVHPKLQKTIQQLQKEAPTDKAVKKRV